MRFTSVFKVNGKLFILEPKKGVDFGQIIYSLSTDFLTKSFYVKYFKHITFNIYTVYN